MTELYGVWTMNRLIRKFFGFYTLLLPADKAPEILNACKEKGIFFFSPEPTENGITVKASLFSCKPLMAEGEKHGVQAEITEESGLPFIVSRYRKRYGIYLGIILGAAFLLFSSLFLWDVQVTGNVNISEKEILKVLARHGVGIGTYIPSMDADRTAEYILLDYSPLSSLAINVKGTVATVDVIERVPKPESVFPEDGYCNLVAKADGIITSVTAVEGHPEVKVGQVVTEGQLLINGFVENRFGAYKIVNAKGYIFADVAENLLFEVPLDMTGKYYTGRTETKTEIYLIGFPIRLFFKEETEFEKYDIRAAEESLTLFGLKLPIKISKALYAEYEEAQYSITEEEAKREAQKRFNAWCQKEAMGEIVSIDTEEGRNEKNNVYFIKAHVVVNRDIGMRKEIIFTYPNKLP